MQYLNDVFQKLKSN